MAFDYVLYLACLVFGAELAYVESRFQLLGENRDYYLLFSALLFFASAYRFDNRFVLSLALSTLAAWFGLKISAFRIMSGEPLRIAAMAYGGLVALSGVWLSEREIKKHFLQTYLHVAANVLFIAFLSGIFERESRWLYFGGLIVMALISITAGARFRSYAFVAYGTVYGYIGISVEILRSTAGTTAELLYFVISGTIVIASIVLLARRLARE
jgi:hypothetical protein